MRKIFFNSLALTLLFAAFHFSCDKKIGKSQFIITPAPTADTTKTVSECDTITYDKHIKTIVKQYCGSAPGCHTSGVSSGDIDFDTYTQVKTYGLNGKIKQTVYNSVPKPMPPPEADQLTDAQKKLINCWLNNGFKN